MLKYVKSDTDLCRYYEGGSPYIYEMNVCPHCGFSFSDNFNEFLGTQQIARFLKTVSKNWKKQNYCGERDINSAIEAYKLGLLSAQVANLKSMTMAGICLRICWLYRMLGDNEQEMRFMKEAAGLYEKSYGTEDTGDKAISPEILVYLLGEMNFRLGNKEKSYSWFNIALTQYSRSPLVKKQTADMIKDRWMEIKDEFKKQSTK
jgi:uncharacterized protein (DUF2225 family)